MILRARRADGPNRSAHDRRRFPIPCAIAVRSRCPINRVLQNTRDGVVVLGRHEQDGVRLSYAPLQLHNFGGWVLFLVLIETRNPVNLEDVDGRAFRHKLGCGAQGGAIVGFAAKAAGDAENANGFAHLCSPYGRIG